MTLNNYLITRFNVPYKKLYRNNDDKKEWMKERKKLFEKYCLPSVLNQSSNNFKWIICISPNTRKKNLAYFDDLKQKVDGVKYLKVGSMYEVKKVVGKLILKNTEKGTYVSTTRLDTDDVICRDIISTIETVFNFQNRQPISWAKGYQLLIKKNILRVVDYPRGPFKSLIEKNDGSIETVHGKEHMRWDEQKELYGKPYWCQVIHESNVSGHTVNGLPVRKFNLNCEFGVNVEGNIAVRRFITETAKYYRDEVRTKIFKLRKKVGIE
jgi:hypothetical protein